MGTINPDEPNFNIPEGGKKTTENGKNSFHGHPVVDNP